MADQEKSIRDVFKKEKDNFLADDRFKSLSDENKKVALSRFFDSYGYDYLKNSRITDKDLQDALKEEWVEDTYKIALTPSEKKKAEISGETASDTGESSGDIPLKEQEDFSTISLLEEQAKTLDSLANQRDGWLKGFKDRLSEGVPEEGKLAKTDEEYEQKFNDWASKLKKTQLDLTENIERFNKKSEGDPQPLTKKEQAFKASPFQGVSFNFIEKMRPEEGKKFWDTYVGDMIERIGAGGATAVEGLSSLQNMPYKVAINKATQGLDPKLRKDIADIYLSSIPATASNQATQEYFKEKAKGLRGKSDRYEGKDFTQLWKEDKGAALGELFLTASESIPISAAAMFGGAPGLVVLGLIAGAGKYDELSYPEPPTAGNYNEINFPDISVPDDEIKDYINKTNMGEVAKLTNAVATGAFEYLSERLGSKAFGDYIVESISKIGGEATKDVIKTGISKWTAKMFEKFGLAFGPVIEGGEEGVNKLAENTVDYFTGVTDKWEITKDVKKSFWYGFAGGTQFSMAAAGPIMYGKIKQIDELNTAKSDIKTAIDGYIKARQHKDGRVYEVIHPETKEYNYILEGDPTNPKGDFVLVDNTGKISNVNEIDTKTVLSRDNIDKFSEYLYEKSIKELKDKTTPTNIKEGEQFNAKEFGYTVNKILGEFAEVEVLNTTTNQTQIDLIPLEELKILKTQGETDLNKRIEGIKLTPKPVKNEAPTEDIKPDAPIAEKPAEATKPVEATTKEDIKATEELLGDFTQIETVKETKEGLVLTRVTRPDGSEELITISKKQASLAQEIIDERAAVKPEAPVVEKPQEEVKSVKKEEKPPEPKTKVKEAMVKPLTVLRQELDDMKAQKARGSKDEGLDAKIAEWEEEIKLQEELSIPEEKGRTEEVVETEKPPEKETDASRIQQIKNSIREGEMILKSGKKVSGEKMTPEELDHVRRSVESAKAKLEPQDKLETLKKEYESKPVEELVALKKKLYPSPDIESAMTPEEKLLTQVIADKFSKVNAEVVEKRKKKENANLEEDKNKAETPKKAFPKTVRELSNLEAEEQSGLLSGAVFSTMEQGDTIKLGRDKTITVTKKTKPSKQTYAKLINGKKYEGSYDRITLALTDSKGKKYSADLWFNWVQNGQKMVSRWVRKGETRKSDPWGNLSRDIEADITVDLLNENNQFHDVSDSFKRVQKYLDTSDANLEGSNLDTSKIKTKQEDTIKPPVKEAPKKEAPKPKTRVTKNNIAQDIERENKAIRDEVIGTIEKFNDIVFSKEQKEKIAELENNTSFNIYAMELDTSLEDETMLAKIKAAGIDFNEGMITIKFKDKGEYKFPANSIPEMLKSITKGYPIKGESAMLYPRASTNAPMPKKAYISEKVDGKYRTKEEMIAEVKQRYQDMLDNIEMAKKMKAPAATIKIFEKELEHLRELAQYVENTDFELKDLTERAATYFAERFPTTSLSGSEIGNAYRLLEKYGQLSIDLKDGIEFVVDVLSEYEKVTTNVEETIKAKRAELKQVQSELDDKFMRKDGNGYKQPKNNNEEGELQRGKNRISSLEKSITALGETKIIKKAQEHERIKTIGDSEAFESEAQSLSDQAENSNEVGELEELSEKVDTLIEGVDSTVSDIQTGKEPWEMTKEAFGLIPRFHQHLFAGKMGIEKDVRIRDKSTQSLIDKTSKQTKGETGEQSPNEFYADGRDLHKEIVMKALSEGKEVPADVLADYPEFAEKPVTWKPEDLDYEIAYRAYSAISFDPEKRAEQTQKDYVASMDAMYKKLSAIAKSPEQIAETWKQMQIYKDGYLKHEKAYLAAKGRTMSSMITGPANFPVERNRKALAAEQKRGEEFIEWDKKNEKRAIAAVRGEAPQEQKDAEHKNTILRTIDDKLATIISIDTGKNLYTSRQLIVSNLSGFIKRIAKNGQVDDVKLIMDHIKTVQKDLKKPIFSANNPIWNLESTMQPKEDLTNKESQTIGKYKGVEIVNNHAIERVQLLFDDKPSEEVRTKLKSRGFHWSPREKAWQRKNTPEGIRVAKQIADGLFGDEIQKPDIKLKSTPRPIAKTPSDLTSGEFAKQQAEFDLDVRESINEAANEIGYTDNVEVVTHQNELPQNIRKASVNKKGEEVRIKGAFDPVTGKIYIVSQNSNSAEDAVMTLIHELVGHKGLRYLFGDTFDVKMKEIYKSIPEATINNLKKQGYKGEVDIAEEFISRTAELEEKPKWYTPFLSWLRDLFRKRFNIKYSHQDILNIISQSRDAIKRKGSKKPTVRFEDKTSEVDNNIRLKIDEEGIEGEILPETSKYMDARKESLQRNKDYYKRFRTFMQDRDLALRDMLEAAWKAGGMKTEGGQPYRDRTLSYGKMEYLFKGFKKGLIKPLIKTVSKMLKIKGIDKNMVMVYKIAKHAPERNMHFRVKEIEKLLPTEDIELTDEIEAKIEEINKRDFSGISALDINQEYSDNPDALAERLVKEFESKVPSELIDEFWQKQKAATDFVVDQWRESESITEEEHDEIKKMYDHYVPLRGWFEASEKQLLYHTKSGKGSSIQKAKGRESLPDDPLVYIQQMGFKAIQERITNEVNNSLLEFVMSNPNDELYEIKDVYYIKRHEGTGEEVWVTTIKRPSKEMFKEGNAKRVLYSGHQRLRTLSQAKQHEVIIHLGKQDVAIVMKGEMLPVAQIMNNQNTLVRIKGRDIDIEHLNSVLGNTFGRITNLQKRLMTSWNIVFPPKNVFRDIIEAGLTSLITGGPKQAAYFVAYVPTAFKTIATSIYHPSKFNPTENAEHQRYVNFQIDGGPTGFTHEQSIEDLSRELERAIKNEMRGFRVNAAKVTAQLEFMNQLFEDVTRFSIYVSAIKAGYSRKDAAAQAKEASVNFNRKGKGTKSFDSLIAFWNPSIQSLQKNAHLGKKYPKAFTAVATGMMLFGFLMAELNRLFDDDDDENGGYYNVNPWMRDNYLIIPKSNGEYLSIPLPPFWRGFYSWGTITSDFIHGERSAEDAAGTAVLNFIAGLSPIDIGGFYTDGEFRLAPIIPTFVKPFYEVANNRNYFGGRIYREVFDKTILSSKLHARHVNPAMKFFTDGLVSLVHPHPDSGVKIYDKDGKIVKIPGWADINPSKAEHILSGYLAGTGNFIAETVGLAFILASPDEKIVADNIPFINQFIRTYPEKNWEKIGEYYDALEEVANNRKLYKQAINAKNKDKNLADPNIYMTDEKMRVESILYGRNGAQKRIDNLQTDYELGKLNYEEFMDKRADIMLEAVKEIKNK